jgi:PilZ domain
VLKKDDKVFLRLPKEDAPKKRNLRPGIVVAIDNGTCTVELAEPAAGVQEGVDAFLHFETRRKFVQQAMKVVRTGPDDARSFVAQLHGEPVSAESRQAFRVSCLSANIRAVIAGENDCEVVDLSNTGFGFYGKATYELGQRVRVALAYGGKDHTGQGTIQSVRRMTAGVVRYGVHCADGAGDNLARSLPSISMQVQAEQLRRLSSK